MKLCTLIWLTGCLLVLAGSGAIAASPARADRSSGTSVEPLQRTGAQEAPATIAKPPAAVAAPLSSDPAGRGARGTMILVHGGGWAGHDARAQALLSQRPGSLLLQRGWRVVSIDYNEGADGLQDVLDTAGAELQRASRRGPLCIYGESAGAHLALVAASRLREIDCVIGLGTPTDLALYRSQGADSPDFRVRLVVSQINRLFGTTPAELGPWDLVSLAPAVDADVLLLQEGDDMIVPGLHSTRFQAARPTTQLVALQAGEPADPASRFVHGTISDSGRARYAEAIDTFAGRAVAFRQAERKAARIGCGQAKHSIARIALPALRNALRCLVRRHPRSRPRTTSGWKQTTLKLRGDVSAARIWAHLHTTKSGIRALGAVGENRAKMTLRIGDPSRVTFTPIP